MKSRQSRGSAREPAEDMTYAEARTALDLSLAQLQATDLDVEAMANLFQRAQSYARRCELLLARVEQDVLLWDAGDPEAAPRPYQSEPSGKGPQDP
jgi:exodeoxyribonuclease VII small subunit